jgi:hypothetical protein
LLSIRDGSPVASGCRWRRGVIDTSESQCLSDAAWLVAREIVDLRCGRTALYSYWLRRVSYRGGRVNALSGDLAIALLDSIGTKQEPGSDDHLEGHIAEVIWAVLLREHEHPAGTLIDRSEVKTTVYGQGGDGHALYLAEDSSLTFRLWESKKNASASNSLQATTTGAYRQIRKNGARYVAQLVAANQRKAAPVGPYFAQLHALWRRKAPSIGVGVALATHVTDAPDRHFDNMDKLLPDFAAAQLEGSLVGIGDFCSFAEMVRARLWKGL